MPVLVCNNECTNRVTESDINTNISHIATMNRTTSPACTCTNNTATSQTLLYYRQYYYRLLMISAIDSNFKGLVM